MGLEKVEILGQLGEKEGGIVGAKSKPVNDRIDDPKSKSKIISKVFVFVGSRSLECIRRSSVQNLTTIG